MAPAVLGNSGEVGIDRIDLRSTFTNGDRPCRRSEMSCTPCRVHGPPCNRSIGSLNLRPLSDETAGTLCRIEDTRGSHVWRQAVRRESFHLIQSTTQERMRSRGEARPNNRVRLFARHTVCNPPQCTHISGSSGLVPLLGTADCAAWFLSL